MYQVRLLIGERDANATGGATFDRRDPIRGDVATRAAAATVADAEAAANAAAAAFPAWSATSPAERRAVLNRAADLLVERTAEFVKAMAQETGAAAMWATFNCRLAASMLREAASMTTQLTGEVIPSDKPGLLAMAVRQPAGVCLGIAPWNAPVILGVRAAAMPLACGIPKLADGASIFNLASLAGFDWPNQVSSILESEHLDFDDVAEFVRTHDAGEAGGRSYFFSQEALGAWTLKNRWTWRDRGIRMNAVSPGPVDTPILGDFVQTLGARAEEDMRVMDRPGTPADIAPVVAFLLSTPRAGLRPARPPRGSRKLGAARRFLESDARGWIRGANLPVDGGMSSHLLCNLHGL